MTISMTRRSTGTPLLRPTALASGTLPARDLAATRAFYEEVLGLEVRQPSEHRLMVRLGYDHIYEVEVTDGEVTMPLLSHNGIGAWGDIVEAHAAMAAQKERYGIRKLTKPGLNHGTFGYYLQDLDGNWWEINPEIQGPSENFLPDLSDGPDMSPEEARRRFQPDGDILQDAVDAAKEHAPRSPAKPSILQSACITHGTLESMDLHVSRRFYEEVLGLEVRQLTPASFMVGLGTDHRYAVVAAPQSNPDMMYALRNRLLFPTEQDVADARAALLALEGYHLTDFSEIVRQGNGRVGFELRDFDRNWWELYYDPQGLPTHYFD